MLQLQAQLALRAFVSVVIVEQRSVFRHAQRGKWLLLLEEVGQLAVLKMVLVGDKLRLAALGLIYFLIYGLNLGTDYFIFDDAFNLSKPIIYDHIYLKLYWIWHHSLVPFIHTFWITFDWLGFSSPVYLKTISILIHGFNSFFLYVLLKKVNKNFKIGDTAVVFVPILFLLHPMSVETVSWISEQKTLFSFMFTLLSLNFLLDKKNIASLLLFIISVLFKPASIMIPAIAFIYSGFFSSEKKENYKFSILKIITIATVGIYLLGLIEFYENEAIAHSEYSLLYRLFSSGVIFLSYVKKLVMPIDLHFGYFLSFSTLKNYTSHEFWGLLFAFLAIVSVILLAQIKKDRRIMFLTLSFFILTIPYLAFITYGYHAISLLADHYMYFALVPFLLVIVLALEHYKVNKIVIPLLVIFCSYQTYFYAKDWRSNKEVLNRSLLYSPQNVAINVAKANLLLNSKYELAELEDFTKRIETNKVYSSELFYLLKKLYMKEGDFNKALELERSEAIFKK